MRNGFEDPSGAPRSPEHELREVAYRLSSFIGDQLRSCVPGLLASEGNALQKAQFLLRRLKELWPEHNGSAKPRFFLHTLLPDYSGVVVRFEPLSGEGEFSGTVQDGEMVFGLKMLIEATTEAEMAEGVLNVLAMIHHEVEHFVYPGASLEDFGDGDEAVARYLAHPGEMRAFAKQFAFLYAQAHPGEPFSLEAMQALCRTNAAKNYFLSMVQPETQKRYAPYADFARVHQEMIALTSANLP